jgi:hypothetical protein
MAREVFGTSKVSKSVRDLVLVGSESFGPISEVKFALNLEVTKLLWVLTIEGKIDLTLW